MSHIDVTRAHDLGLDGARHAAEEVVHELSEHLSLRAHWEGDTLVASGTGFDGRFHAEPDYVRVTVDLSFMLRPLRRSIRSEIDEYLDRYTAG
jgi:putative polyhydroxyalkanoate system protein